MRNIGKLNILMIFLLFSTQVSPPMAVVCLYNGMIYHFNASNQVCSCIYFKNYHEFFVRLIVCFNLADCLGSIEKEFILNLLENNVAVWLMSASSPLQHVHTLLDKLDKVPDDPIPSHFGAVADTRNTALHIFTSGSTGEDVC